MLANAKATSGFAVPDTAEAKRFYGETLGLEVAVLSEENGVMALKLTGGDVFLYRKPDFEPATYTILNFEVDDIDAAVDELTSGACRLSATTASSRTRRASPAAPAR
jgi:catechol 2,3-dioxygenase-like lactoylglutathione lyase family enzyme